MHHTVLESRTFPDGQPLFTVMRENMTGNQVFLIGDEHTPLHAIGTDPSFWTAVTNAWNLMPDEMFDAWGVDKIKHLEAEIRQCLTRLGYRGSPILPHMLEQAVMRIETRERIATRTDYIQQYVDEPEPTTPTVAVQEPEPEPVSVEEMPVEEMLEPPLYGMEPNAEPSTPVPTVPEEPQPARRWWHSIALPGISFDWYSLASRGPWECRRVYRPLGEWTPFIWITWRGADKEAECDIPHRGSGTLKCGCKVWVPEPEFTEEEQKEEAQARWEQRHGRARHYTRRARRRRPTVASFVSITSDHAEKARVGAIESVRLVTPQQELALREKLDPRTTMSTPTLRAICLTFTFGGSEFVPMEQVAMELLELTGLDDTLTVTELKAVKDFKPFDAGEIEYEVES